MIVFFEVCEMCILEKQLPINITGTVNHLLPGLSNLRVLYKNSFLRLTVLQNLYIVLKLCTKSALQKTGFTKIKVLLQVSAALSK